MRFIRLCCTTGRHVVHCFHMEEESKISIAIVSQSRLFRQGLNVMLEGIDYPVQVILSSGTVDKIFEDKPVPDIVLLHIDKNETAAIMETISSFKLQYPAVHLLMIPSEFDKEFLKQLRQSDASGYLFMYSEPDDFKTAFSQVIKGRKHYQQPQFLPGDFDNISHIIRSFFE